MRVVGFRHVASFQSLKSRPNVRIFDPPPVRITGVVGEMFECRFHTGDRPFGGGLLGGPEDQRCGLKRITHL